MTLVVFASLFHDGDPESVRIIDWMNWTGLGIAPPIAR
jgi:hypothetical protein